MEQKDEIKKGNNRFLEFKLGEEHYAIELLMVREVITPPDMTPIPKAPPHVCGLMNLRGLVLTVVDLRKRLGITPSKESSENAIIIFDLGDRLIGAWVDSICRVVNIEGDMIKPVPEAENASVTQYLTGILQFQSKLTLWLDINKLLAGTPQPATQKSA